jgi:MYXO-CTERM domain-containing protein
MYADEQAPVTLHYTRVDGAPRFRIGTWLKGLGVETINSCSGTPDGCPKNEWTGGLPGDAEEGTGTTTPPTGDSGTVEPPEEDAGGGSTGPTNPPDDPKGPEEGNLGPDPDDEQGLSGEEPDYADAAVAKKKKKKEEGGCSTTPGHAPAGSVVLGFGVVIALAALRRRRSRRV